MSILSLKKQDLLLVPELRHFFFLPADRDIFIPRDPDPGRDPRT